MSGPDESKLHPDHERESNAIAANLGPAAGAAQAVARAPDAVGPANELPVLDELAFPTPSRTLSAADLRLLQAMQRVLEARQSDAWINKIKAQIAAELEPK